MFELELVLVGVLEVVGQFVFDRDQFGHEVVLVRGESGERREGRGVRGGTEVHVGLQLANLEDRVMEI